MFTSGLKPIHLRPLSKSTHQVSWPLQLLRILLYKQIMLLQNQVITGVQCIALCHMMSLNVNILRLVALSLHSPHQVLEWRRIPCTPELSGQSCGATRSQSTPCWVPCCQPPPGSWWRPPGRGPRPPSTAPSLRGWRRRAATTSGSSIPVCRVN